MTRVRECFLEVDKSTSVPDIVVLDLLDGLLAALLGHVNGLDNWSEVLLHCQLQHGKHLWSGTNVRSSHLASVWCKSLCLELWQVVVWKTDIVELPVDLECAQYAGDVELVSHVGAVEDEIELECIVLYPLLVRGINEVIGTELHGLLLLVWRVRDGVDLSSKTLGPEKTKMSKSTNSHDTNSLSWSDLGAVKRREGRQTSAPPTMLVMFVQEIRTRYIHHWSRILGLDSIWDWEDKILISTNMRGVSSLCSSTTIPGLVLIVLGSVSAHN